jgi:hypothetical protein
MLTWLIRPLCPGPIEFPKPDGNAQWGWHLLDRKVLSRPLNVIRELGAGRGHDMIEALLELVDNIVSRLGLQHSDE